jgi:hypothetical protein
MPWIKSLGLKSEAEISAVPMGLRGDVVWIDAKVWRKAMRKKYRFKAKD